MGGFPRQDSHALRGLRARPEEIISSLGRGVEMKNPELPGGRPESSRNNRAILPVWIAAIVAVVILAVYLSWHFANRAEILRSSGVSLSFSVAPDTIPVMVPSRFEVLVRGPDGNPMPGRPINLTVSPEGNSSIISVSGSAVSTRAAWGNSDGSGNVTAMIRAEAPGEYNLVAADSGGASAAGVSVRFHAR